MVELLGPLLVAVVVGMLYIRQALLKQKRPTVLPRLAFAALFLIGGLLGVLALIGLLSLRGPLPQGPITNVLSAVAFLSGGCLVGVPFILWVTRPRTRYRRNTDPDLLTAPSDRMSGPLTPDPRVTAAAPPADVMAAEEFTATPPVVPPAPDFAPTKPQEEVIPGILLPNEPPSLPPESDQPEEVGTRPVHKLFSPGDVALATFLGGLVGGGVVLALNYRTQRKVGAAWACVLLTLLAQSLILLMLTSLSDSQGTAFGLGSAVGGIIGMYQVAKVLQGRKFDKHMKQGGEKASGWGAALVGVVSIAVTFVVAVGLAFAVEGLFGLGMGTPVTFGPGEEVYFTGGATKEDALRLGWALKELQFFNGIGGKTVLVEKSRKGYAVSLVVRKSAASDPLIIKEMERMRTEISRKAFDGIRVELRLCDEYMTTLKTLAGGGPAGPPGADHDPKPRSSGSRPLGGGR